MSSIENLEKSIFTRCVVKSFLAVVCVLVLFAPLFFRPLSSFFYGFEAYFHLSSGVLKYVLSFFSYVFNVDVFLVAKFLPLVLGVFSLLLSSAILRKLGFAYPIVVLSSLILIFSPSFIFLFSTLTDFAFIVFLLLSIFYLLLVKRHVPALVLFYLISFFGILPLLLSSSLLLFYFAKIQRVKIFFYSLPSFALLFFSPAVNLSSSGSFISDLGGSFGVGLFVLLLSFFGLGFFWKDKYDHFYLYVSILVLVLFSFFNLRFLSILNFFLVVFAALGLLSLFERRWKSPLIKSLTLIILVVGLFISSFSYTSSLVHSLPNKDVIDALYSLRDLPDGVVFSDSSREYWVGFAGKHFVSYTPLLYTRDIGEATSVIESKHISYIWLDKDMESKIWVEEDQGLLFLLKYSGSFEEVYSNDYVKILRFVRTSLVAQ